MLQSPARAFLAHCDGVPDVVSVGLREAPAAFWSQQRACVSSSALFRQRDQRAERAQATAVAESRAEALKEVVRALYAVMGLPQRRGYACIAETD